MSKLIKKKLAISGMHCTSCAINIDFDIEDVEGVKSVKTSYSKQESEIEYDEDVVKIESLYKVIEKLGYKASIKQ